jgi:hypothetical protein
MMRLRGSPSRRIAALARSVRDADSVVLHVDPGDVVAAAALSGSDRPAVMLVNHADHVFWAGADIADAVICIRTSGLELARRRRAVPASRSAIVPIPIPDPQSPASAAVRAAARAQLGIPERSVLVLSVASPYKFRAVAGVGMIDVAEAILEADPRLMLLVAGPTAIGAWAALEDRSAGRARAVGPVQDLEPLFAAADIYLDSYPFASLTSMLEAGSHGLPLIALQDHPDGCEVLSSDSAGLTELMTARSLPGLTSRLTELADDPSARTVTGARTAAAIAARHAGASWRRSLDSAYGVARSSASDRADHVGATADRAQELADRDTLGPLDDLLIELHRGLGGLDHAIAGHLTDRAPLDRARLAITLGHDVRRAAVVLAVPRLVRLTLRSARARVGTRRGR